jgi:hypothetical protein
MVFPYWNTAMTLRRRYLNCRLLLGVYFFACSSKHSIGGRAQLPLLGCACAIKPHAKIIEQSLLVQYVGGVFTPLSKPFKTKQQAEKAPRKYPERLGG